MSMTTRGVTTFQDLGRDYQLQLFNEIITDTKFGASIIPLIDSKYFPSEAFAKIAHILKNYYSKHECLLNYPGLRAEIHINVDAKADTFRQQLLDTVDEIEKCEVSNLNVQATATNFCKLQSLKVAVNQIKTKLDKGILDEYDEIEEKLKKAMTFKEVEDPIEIFDDVDNVLADDYRNPIKTGIDGIDKATKGGLSKGEVGLIIAPLGVGKTTILTKIASNAYLNENKNVLQIFFEDKPKDIQRKHYTAMTEIPLHCLSDEKDVVKAHVEGLKERKNKLWLVKLPAEGATIGLIKNIIKRINSKGDKVDLLALDYIDCLSAEVVTPGKEDWSNEGVIMRKFETMVDEMNVVGWTATQGNRASTAVEIVKVDNMGGNIKKAQIAHVIISVGKTLEQKEQKIATISILKNRVGDDGISFENCRFDNSTLEIDTNDIVSINALTDKRKEEKSSEIEAKAREALKLKRSLENK